MLCLIDDITAQVVETNTEEPMWTPAETPPPISCANDTMFVSGFHSQTLVMLQLDLVSERFRLCVRKRKVGEIRAQQ